jgi:hypothetical protein
VWSSPVEMPQAPVCVMTTIPTGSVPGLIRMNAMMPVYPLHRLIAAQDRLDMSASTVWRTRLETPGVSVSATMIGPYGMTVRCIAGRVILFARGVLGPIGTIAWYVRRTRRGRLVNVK